VGLEQARANKKALEKVERAKRRKKRKFPKGKAEFFHANKRFRERWGINWTLKKERAALNKIKDGGAELYQVLSNRVRIYWIVIERKRIPILVDMKRRKVITAFLPEYLEDGSYLNRD